MDHHLRLFSPAPGLMKAYCPGCGWIGPTRPHDAEDAVRGDFHAAHGPINPKGDN